MRGVTYDYEFEKPDKTKLIFTGQTMSVLLTNIKILTTQHYGLDYKVSRDTIYNIMKRPTVANKFYSAKLVVRKINNPLTPQINTPANTTTTATTTTTTIPTANITQHIVTNTPINIPLTSASLAS